MRIPRVPAILVSIAVAAMLLSAQLIVQHPVTNGGNGPIGGSSAIGLAPAGGMTASSTTSVDASKRATLLYGKVVMPDGTPPSAQVTIERVCSGSGRTQAITDSQGDFSFQPGQMLDAIPDATVDRSSPQSSPVSASNCDLRASLAGYRSDVIPLSGRNPGDLNVGTIRLHRLANVEGLTFSATSALAPKDARKAFEKGIDAVKKSKADEAQADFLKATELYPRYASAWFELGRVLEQRQHKDEARDAYAKAIAADSKYISPYERLYTLSANEQKWDDVVAITDRIMRLNPHDFPEAAMYNAVANLQLEKLDDAEKSARQAVSIDGAGRNPRIHYILGVILVKKQDFKGAAECLRTYLKSDTISDRERVAAILADLEKQVQARN